MGPEPKNKKDNKKVNPAPAPSRCDCNCRNKNLDAIKPPLPTQPTKSTNIGTNKPISLIRFYQEHFVPKAILKVK